MTREKCEWESAVIVATRSGACAPDLAHHIVACEICAETQRIAALFQNAAKTSAQFRPPSAAVVWQRVQAQRQQLLLARAARCMTWMYILAAVYAVVLAAWYLPQIWHLQPALSIDLGTLSGGVIFAGVLTAGIAVVLGSCCLVLLGSRTTSRLRT
jgi:hypothetical protein